MITVTPTLLRIIAPYAKAALVTATAPEFTSRLVTADILSPLRAAHFFAQIAQETDGFRTLEEYASGDAYEGRADLGNSAVGDGRRYKGRGYIMLTGRANYRSAGPRLNQNLELNPELMLSPAVAAPAALNYWTDRGLSHFADRDDELALEHITRAINGGLTGIDTRRMYLTRAKKAFGI